MTEMSGRRSAPGQPPSNAENDVGGAQGERRGDPDHFLIEHQSFTGARSGNWSSDLARTLSDLTMLRDRLGHQYRNVARPWAAQQLEDAIGMIARLLEGEEQTLPPQAANASCLVGEEGHDRAASMPAPLSRAVYVIQAALDPAVLERLRAKDLTVETFPNPRAFLTSDSPKRRGCVVTCTGGPDKDGIDFQGYLEREGRRLHGVRLFHQHAAAETAARLPLLSALEAGFEHLAIHASRTGAQCNTPGALDGLTFRQRQVLGFILDGQPNKRIAWTLSISQRTVETHRAIIMKKVGARSLSELIHLMLAAPSGQASK
jgi:two-component system response regulator FixJ